VSKLVDGMIVEIAAVEITAVAVVRVWIYSEFSLI